MNGLLRETGIVPGLHRANKKIKVLSDLERARRALQYDHGGALEFLA
jgi:hypothetical protein